MLEKISDTMHGVFRRMSGQAQISEKNIRDAVEEIKLALLEADVNLRVVRRFVNATIEESVGTEVLKKVTSGQQFTKIVYERLVKLLGDEKQDLILEPKDKQSVILMMGLQGSGKTTTSAKLAHRLQKEGRRVLLVAADLVRPAAVRQLEVLAKSIDAPVYGPEGFKKPADISEGSAPVGDYTHINPTKVVADALSLAKREQYNTVIVDTTGRLHIDEVMMQQIKDIAAVANPCERLFVADAMTGQQAVVIAKEFNEQVDITGVVLTKFDSDTRGGAALSLRSVLGKPLKFIGVGEKIADLDPFYPERIASRILGMGDVVSLVEKAQETIDEKQAEEMEKRLAKYGFTLEDYLAQFAQIRKMGSASSILEMLPGMKGKLDPSQLQLDGLKREEAIILSMTPQERRNYRILGLPRRKRIAKGSGTSLQEVNNLLKKFEKIRTMMRKVNKSKKLQAQMLKQFGQLGGELPL